MPYALCLTVFLGLVSGACCTCTWPDALAGTWYTSQSYNWTFDSNYLTLDFATYGIQNFECYYTDGYRYLARITNITVFQAIPSYLFDIFICLEFQQLSSYSFLYWRSNLANPSLNGEKARMRAIGFATNTNDACEISKPYTVGTHDIMVKMGFDSQAAVTCPEEFNSNSYYYYDNDANRECGQGNSSLNVCSSVNTFTFDYTACSDNATYMLYSTAGSLYCLYFTTDSGVTYLNLYNRDSTTDNSVSYRFSCLVFSKTGSLILATQHPQSCTPHQTTTFVASPGVDLSFGVESTCVQQDSLPECSPASASRIPHLPSLHPLLLHLPSPPPLPTAVPLIT